MADRYDFGGPANGTFYGVFVDPKQAETIEQEFETLVERPGDGDCAEGEHVVTQT